ncbi:site-specific integrase [Nocardia sp. Marseille-Q1738]
MRYTPHDFRRIFATEAVSNGLPVHIAAKLLGHNDITTTQTYVAVYNDDVPRHHRAPSSTSDPRDWQDLATRPAVRYAAFADVIG